MLIKDSAFKFIFSDYSNDSHLLESSKYPEKIFKKKIKDVCQWLIISKHFILYCLMICFESIPLCFWFQCNRFIKLELNVESKIQKVTDIIDWFTCKYLDSSSLYFNVCFFISNFSIITLTYLLFIACSIPRLIW